MKLIDLKIYAVNSFAMLLNFSTIDLVLKILLTLVAIGYTLHKWYIMIKRNRK